MYKRQLLKKGESISLTWEIHEGKGEDFAEFVSHTWEYCYDTFQPKPVETDYTPDYTKEIPVSYTHLDVYKRQV